MKILRAIAGKKVEKLKKGRANRQRGEDVVTFDRVHVTDTFV